MEEAGEGWRRGGCHLGERWWGVFEDGSHGVGGGFSLERAAPGDHFVKDGAEGEDVAAGVGGLASDLFG